ncbi:MAG: PstS family phosphate ABC transporter substrate-binding protein [Deltaproteobacteria bacterium]|nr:PstS family phosphate ABC transporter substrate-binding protein [Deltaproteobacteria bacterium]
MTKILPALIVAFVMLAFATNADARRKLVKVDGSSTVFPITEAVAEEFQIDNRGAVMVTVGISGTGGGFQKFCRGEIDVADASREIRDKEIEQCKESGIEYIELPIAYDGLAIIVNKQNTWVDYITTEELKKAWEPAAHGVIKKWSQIRASWPDTDIRLFGPGTDSGTFDYFTHAINGESGAVRGDFTASEDDNVLVTGISMDKGALGYFGLAYYEYNADKLRLIPVDDGNDKNGKGPITPTTTTVNDGTYAPLSRPIFIYVSKASLKKAEVKDFVSFYLENATELTEEVGYIPLSKKDYNALLDKIK